MFIHPLLAPNLGYKLQKLNPSAKKKHLTEQPHLPTDFPVAFSSGPTEA